MRRIRVSLWLLGLLLLLAPLAWAGGTKEGTTGTSAAGKAAIQGSIRVWGDTQNETITSKPFQEINAAFMKEYPNVKVTYDFGENNETLQVAIQSDSLYRTRSTLAATRTPRQRNWHVPASCWT